MSSFTIPFAGLAAQSADSLLALIALHRADQRPDKIDVGIGVYRDETGHTPVLRAVKAAEARLVTEQLTKAYLGADGDARFTELLAEIVFGARTAESHRFGLQTPGGTGALRLGAELLARAAPYARVWIGEPTWPNHAPIFAEAGLPTIPHAYFDAAIGDIAFEGMMSALGDARSGDVILLQGCCHNPTGTQFGREMWRQLACLCNRRGLVPFIDLAYQGLAEGLEEDVAGMRDLLGAVPGSLIAYSCDKNFGLYRERVGALWIQASTAVLAELVRTNLLVLSRSLWSMPPDHGAAIVRIILDDPVLTRQWRDELADMRTRINQMRAALATLHPALASIACQRGLFSLLPIDATAVASLRTTHGIYMAANARINMAGLTPANLPRFVEALAPHLSSRGAGPAARADAKEILS